MIKWLPAAVLAVLVAMTAGCEQPAQPGQSGENAGGNTPAANTAAANAPAANAPVEAAKAESGDKGGDKAAKGGDEKAAAPAGGDKGAGGPTKVAEKDYKTLDGGLKYAVLKPGKGDGAKDGQRISMQYTGWLKDGTKFDSSYDHGGQPFEFTLGTGNVIKGWDMGVKGMKPGEKRQLVIPADLGYGAAGSPPVIPGGATLIFDVEMVKAE